MDVNHKIRWVFGPIVDGVHVARDYAVTCSWPMVVDGFALAYCQMNAHQLAAARKDTRLSVLPSIHAGECVPDPVADHHKEHGVKRGMKQHDMLIALAKFHSNFEPEY